MGNYTNESLSIVAGHKRWHTFNVLASEYLLIESDDEFRFCVDNLEGFKCNVSSHNFSISISSTEMRRKRTNNNYDESCKIMSVGTCGKNVRRETSRTLLFL